MKNIITIATLLFVQIFAHAKTYTSSTPTVKSYINKYSDIAQDESKRSGIPTSIILAQAILESEFGNSKLCERSNNHFGIKWKKASDGDFVYSLDDDYDNDGNRIASKFRKYASAESSFKNHSDFLMTRSHYKPLFKYSRTNYKDWANGLRECGYSTEKTYGPKLIEIIHRFNLDKFDVKNNVENKTVSVKKTKKATIKTLSDKNFIGRFFYMTTQGEDLKVFLKSIGSDQEMIEVAKPMPTNAPLEKSSLPTQSGNDINVVIQQDRLKAIVSKE
jgi:Mannosyl-glycoprotein endo-beta-N-acetylglucosaminidase